jgi:hypothetical protein
LNHNENTNTNTQIEDLFQILSGLVLLKYEELKVELLCRFEGRTWRASYTHSLREEREREY